MADEFKHTKNQFKSKIRQMDYHELMKEYNDLNLQIIKGRFEISTGGNPYHKGKYPMKILKWKKALVNQEMLKKVNPSKSHPLSADND